MARKFSPNPKVDAKLKKAVEFFKEHAGGIVGRRMEGALALARAEATAEALGWECEWEHDEDEYQLGDAEDEYPDEVLTCVLRDENGDVLGSIGSIGDPDKNYGRVVEAELALDALSEKGLL